MKVRGLSRFFGSASFSSVVVRKFISWRERERVQMCMREKGGESCGEREGGGSV